MPKKTKIAIPIALVGVIVAVLIWLSNRALATEHRLSTVEVESRGVACDIGEIKRDVREIKQDIRMILTDKKEASNGRE